MKNVLLYQKKKKVITFGVILLIGMILIPENSVAQTKDKIAVSNIDTRGIEIDPVAMGNLVRIELEKLKIYEVLDKYDMKDLLAKEGISMENCYGRTCILTMGKVLNVDVALTGSIERFSDKLVISFRLFEVSTGNLLKTDVAEYKFEPQEIDLMIQISLNNVFDIENDKNLVELLANYEEPISSIKRRVSMSGPRMGVAYVTGDFATALMDPVDQGGYDGYPVVSQLGYQQEMQYLSAGNFNALVEVMGMVSGMEQGLFIPSLIFMNGFRFGEGNWEIAFGPSVGIRKSARGYYDGGNNWHLEEDWYNEVNEGSIPYSIVERFDSRGLPELNSRWIWAVGKTFQSGYLNIPCNIYVSPMKQGWYVGASVGFNVRRGEKSALGKLLE